MSASLYASLLNELSIRRGILIAALIGFLNCPPALAQIALAGTSDRDWTVLTMAPNGSWGTATENTIGDAIAYAIHRCRVMANAKLGCGAYLVSIQNGWSLGLRCGNRTIIVAASTLAGAEQAAVAREAEIRRLALTDVPECKRIVTVNPNGVALIAPPVASGPTIGATSALQASD